MKDWQPIETAPKDGRWLLLWCQFERAEAVIARYVETEARGRRGRFVWCPTGYDGSIAEEVPTHWMPLPDPPK